MMIHQRISCPSQVQLEVNRTSVNEAETLALRTIPTEAYHPNLHNLMVEADSSC